MNPSAGYVAALAGGGVGSRLSGLLQSARAATLYQDLPPESTAQVRKLLDEWKAVLERPDSIDDFFFGHPYRTMVSFCRASGLDDLKLTRARFYLAQGTADPVVKSANLDSFLGVLLAQGRDVIADLIADADHGFQFPADPSRDGQRELFERIRTWFLG